MNFGTWCRQKEITADKTVLLSIGTDGLGRSATLLAVNLVEPDTKVFHNHFVSGADIDAVSSIIGIDRAQYDEERKAPEDVLKLVQTEVAARPYVVSYAHKFASPFLGNSLPGVFPSSRFLDVQRLASRIVSSEPVEFSKFDSWTQLCFWTQCKQIYDEAPQKLDALFRLATGTTEDQLFGDGIPQLYMRPRQLYVIWQWITSV